jgi:coproporphyrinogen III oxidase
MVTLIFFLLQKWEYMHEPKPNSPEEKLMKVLKEPRDWLNIEKTKRSKA